LFRNLLTALFEHERIETTEAKAKELRGLTDKVISLGKEGTLHARRRALRVLQSKAMVSKLFSDVAARFHDRTGGYTRTIKTRRRPGDAAEMVAIELIERSATTPSPTPVSPSTPVEGN
jgi:large subunit ribosomal protein L17